MQIKRTAPELLAQYRRLTETAKTLDQTNLDKNEDKDYVNVEFQRAEPSEGQWGLHGYSSIHSHPSTHTKTKVEGLIERTTKVKKFAIEEQQYAETADAGRVGHFVSFEDDGRSLRVSERVVSYNDDDFLATEQQDYIIYHKSGKMRTLKPQSHPAPF